MHPPKIDIITSVSLFVHIRCSPLSLSLSLSLSLPLSLSPSLPPSSPLSSSLPSSFSLPSQVLKEQREEAACSKIQEALHHSVGLQPGKRNTCTWLYGVLTLLAT